MTSDERSPDDDVDRRAAQDAAAELARMGIDPGVLGLTRSDAPSAAHAPEAPPPPAPAPPSEPPPPRGSAPVSLFSPPPPTLPAPPAPPPAVPEQRHQPPTSDPGYPGRVLVELPLGDGGPPTRVWGYVPPPVEHPRAVPEAVKDEPPTVSLPEDALSRRLATDSTVPIGPPVPSAGAAPSPPPAKAPPPTVKAPSTVEPLDVEAASTALGKAADHYAPMLPGFWHRTLRAVTLGIITPSAAQILEAQRSLVSRVRLRKREPSTVVFIAGKGGLGTTTTAAGVGLTLAALRTDGTALVDVRRGPALLGHRLGVRGAPTISALAEVAEADVTETLRPRKSLAVVDAAPWQTPVTAQQLGRALQNLRGNGNMFVLGDIGNDHGEAAQAALSRADAIVVVTTASQDALASTRVVLARVYESDPTMMSRVVIALVCLTARQQRRQARRLRGRLGQVGHRIVAVPFDPALATGEAVDLTRLRADTREAFLRLAAFTVDPAGDDPDHGRRRVASHAGSSR